MTEAEIQAEVEALCEYDAPTQFVEISGTYQKDRRYFAGSGVAVDGNDWDVDLSNEKRFSENACDKTMIKWPEYAARLQYNTDNGYGTNGYPTNMNLNTSCALKTAIVASRIRLWMHFPMARRLMFVVMIWPIRHRVIILPMDGVSSPVVKRRRTVLDLPGTRARRNYLVI